MKFLSKIEEIVNPDEVALRLSPEAPERVALQAGRETLSRIGILISARRSFAIETTLSGRGYLNTVRTAKSQKWKVGLVYVGLKSHELALERVRVRHAAGGHSVPPEDIARRYERSLANIPAFLEVVDRAIFFDNSSNDGPERLLEFSQHKIVFTHRNLPSWLRRAVGSQKPMRTKRER
jgi:predicted ABC-type ATPase